MIWATRTGVHIDRAACAWLIRRFVDSEAQFVFVTDPAEVPDNSTAFDIPGASLSHQASPDGRIDCSFETFLRHYELVDPVLWQLAQIVHEADLDDERYDEPTARGLDVMTRGLAMVASDQQVLDLTALLFDGLYEYHRRALLHGREPA